ncbi:hypothetical protein COCNU_07G013030 [Cocos nucifera]|uniref:Uncharacterized protein n=1 Tax=Cocos nucifera TaxID=13894 RepID=A0A8K0N5H7_COCNU|nr:hypothetical protein COCNU_07G013030 [Cocos nucifera]
MSLSNSSFNIPSMNIDDDNVSSDIDAYQEDDITNPSVFQANEELNTPNLLIDFSWYEMLDDDEICKLRNRLKEAIVEEEEEEEEEDEEDVENEEEEKFEDDDEADEEKHEFELLDSDND